MKKSSRSSRTSAFEYLMLPVYVAIILAANACLYLTFHSCAHGQEREELPSSAELSSLCAPEVQEGRRFLVTREGVEGFWFHPDVGRCLLKRYGTLPSFAQRVEEFEARRLVQEGRDELQERRVALAEEEADTATGVLEEAVRGRREAEETLNAWHRSRALWFAVGAVVIIVVQVVTVWAYSALTP